MRHMANTTKTRLDLLMVAALTVLASAITGCASSPEQVGGEVSDSVVPTTQAPADRCAADGHQAGCPCTDEGKRVACGVVYEKRPDGRTVCGEGGAVCTGGQWSACVLDGIAK